MKYKPLYYLLAFLLITDISFPFEGKVTIIKWGVLILTSICLLTLPKNKFSIDICSVFYFLFLTVSIFSTLIHSGINFKSITYIFPYLLMFFIYLNFLTSNFDLYRLICILGNVSVFSVLVSIPMIAFPSFYEDSRFHGIYGNPNSMSGFAALSAAFVFSKLISVKQKTNKNYILYSLAFIMSCFIIIILSKSRASLGVFFGIFAFSVIFIDFGIKLRYKLILSLITSFLSISSYVYSSTLFLSSVDSKSRNLLDFSNRLSIFEAQLNSFLYSPMVGVGFVIDKSVEFSRRGGELSYSDILSFSGGIGFLFFMLINVFSFLYLYKNRRVNNNIVIIFVCILLLSIFEGYISNVGSLISILYWAVVSFTFKGVHEKN
ncbi:hypothetical protein D5018_06945 [Parashewanella curva]|uniref:O-antigen ligase domain-containing protein n=1 Tax=Parashewanella curva TaxID=2338552 RepID=A0A3L8Q0Q3_9GAMM|nr:hypothetical protein [Parashewanella curva]RLV60388.1 hypothetical protein D5018_06945 [Parashewanella curva]